MRSRSDGAFELSACFGGDFRVVAEPPPLATTPFAAAGRLAAATFCLVAAVFVGVLLGDGAPDLAGTAFLTGGAAPWPAGLLGALAFFAGAAFLAGRRSADSVSGTCATSTSSRPKRRHERAPQEVSHVPCAPWGQPATWRHPRRRQRLRTEQPRPGAALSSAIVRTILAHHTSTGTVRLKKRP